MKYTIKINDVVKNLDEKTINALAAVFLPKSADSNGLAGVTFGGDIARLDLCESVATSQGWKEQAERLAGKTMTFEWDEVTPDNSGHYMVTLKDAGNIQVFARNAADAIRANMANRQLVDRVVVWENEKVRKTSAVTVNPLESAIDLLG